MASNPGVVRMLTVKNNIVLPGPDGVSAAVLITDWSKANLSIKAEHNTVNMHQANAGQGYHSMINVGEMVNHDGFVGQFTSIQDNLVWGLLPTTAM